MLLTVKKVEFQGKLVPAIRVAIQDKPAQSITGKATVAPPTDDDAEHDDVPF